MSGCTCYVHWSFSCCMCVLCVGGVCACCMCVHPVHLPVQELVPELVQVQGPAGQTADQEQGRVCGRGDNLELGTG